MKRTSILLSVYLFFLSVSRVCSAVDHEIAVVTRVRGMVMTFYGRDGERTLTTKGQLLFNRAIVNTGASGMVQVRYVKGGSTVFIPPQSEVLFTLEGASETGRLNSGKAIFDVQAPHRGSFDILTPATMMTASEECVSVVTHETTSDNSALFITSGTSLVTEPVSSGWSPFTAPTALYTRFGSPFVHTSSLTPGDTTRLDAFVHAARSMKISAPLTHTLIVKPDSGGSVVPGDTMTALQGYAIELSAKPDPGYVFVFWEVLHGAVFISDYARDSTTVSVTSDALIAARFTDIPAKLYVDAAGEGKTIPEGSAVIPRNTPWKIGAYPFSGYALKRWVPSPGMKIISSDSVSATVLVEGTQGNLRAEFDKRDFPVTINSTIGGIVTPGSNVTVATGDTLRITAVPEKGFSFIRWDITGGNPVIANQYAATTTLQCDSGGAKIMAIFNKSIETAKIYIHNHECADISPCGNIAVPRGEAFTILTKPLPGYQLNKWVERLGKATIINGEKTAVRVLTNCELLPDITTKTFNLSINSRGPGSTAPSGSNRVFYNTPSTINATPVPGKRFACWEVVGGDAEISSKLSPRTTVKLSSTDAVIAAEFAEVICTLIVDATVGGYIEPADTQVLYMGKQIGVKAVPNPRAAFLGWSVESGKDNIDFSDTLTVREQMISLKKIGNVNLIAHFSTQTVELTILNNGLGTTDPEKSVWVPQDKWVPLKAVPAQGNKFLHWALVTGPQCEVRDQFALETEINLGTNNATIKAFFDTASGYATPDFTANKKSGPFQLSITADKTAGTATPAGPITVQRGQPRIITASPLSKYKFHEWVIREGDAILADRYSGTTSVILTKSDAVLEARFLSEKTQLLNVQFFGPENQIKTIVIPYR